MARISRRGSAISGKRSHSDLWKMTKVYCGTEVEFVCLTSRS
jgi:hypothetical protein